MRITFISTLLSSWGGSEELWSKTALYALKNGDQVDVIGFRQQSVPKHIHELVLKGANYYPLPNEILIKKASVIYKLFYRLFVKNSGKLEKIISKINPDVIVVNQGGNSNAFQENCIFSLLERTNKKIILTVRLAKENGRFEFSNTKKAKDIYMKASSVVFASKANQISTEMQLQTSFKNSITCRSPLNIESNALIPMPTNEFIQFGCVARLDVSFKGQDVLLKVLSSQKWKERSWRLNFYGKGEDLQFLENLSSYLEIRNRVVFHGHVKDIRNVWKDNHMHILPSYEEGTPIALMESLICGRPAVVTKVAGNKEVVVDGVTGFFADSCTVESMIKALEKAWSQKSNWETMGQKAHMWAKENLDPNPVETFYKQITQN